MAETIQNLQVAPSPVKQALVERVAIPCLFLVAGYALGFFHGNGRGKRKATQVSQ